MIFFDLQEKKRRLCLRHMKYELISNNSMALRIRYEFFFFKILDYVSKE